MAAGAGLDLAAIGGRLVSRHQTGLGTKAHDLLEHGTEHAGIADAAVAVLGSKVL